MNMYIGIILLILVSYIFGSLPTAFLLTRFIYRVNIFEIGSGNMGGTNVARVMGIHWGIITIIIDAFKGMAAVYVAQKMFPDATLTASVLAAIFAIAGHNWSVFATLLYTRYQKEFAIRGGKGAATAFGTMIMILPPTPVIIMMVVGTIIALLTRYSSLSVLVSFSAAMLWTVVWAVQNNTLLVVLYVAAITALMLVRFRENIQRLAQGKERRIGEST